MERSDAVDNQRRIRPALAYNQRSVELAGGQDADEIEELPLALSASKQSQSVFVCWFVHSFVRSFVCLFVGWLVVKYPLFSHTYSVILCTLHVILPSTLMYFGSSHGSLW